jgi:hypothetical protein
MFALQAAPRSSRLKPLLQKRRLTCGSGFSRDGREHRGLLGNRRMAAGEAPTAPDPA